MVRKKAKDSYEIGDTFLETDPKPEFEPEKIIHDWRGEIWFLSQSKSEAEFYKRLAALILETGKFSDYDRQLLAEQAAIPWRRPRGRPANEERNQKIFFEYHFDGQIHPDDEKRKLPKRVEAIREIMSEYKLTEEAAADAYDKAGSTLGLSPPIERLKYSDKKSPLAIKTTKTKRSDKNRK